MTERPYDRFQLFCGSWLNVGCGLLTVGCSVLSGDCLADGVYRWQAACCIGRISALQGATSAGNADQADGSRADPPLNSHTRFRAIPSLPSIIAWTMIGFCSVLAVGWAV
jgi:hypothetical protein